MENNNLQNIEAIEFKYYKNGNLELTEIMKLDEESIKKNPNFIHLLIIPELYINSKDDNINSFGFTGVNQNISIRLIFKKEYEILEIKQNLINFMNKYGIEKIEDAINEMKKEYEKRKELKNNWK